MTQGLWGLALASNLVRLEMERAAAVAHVPPTRMSFVRCLRKIRVYLLHFVHVSPGKLAAAVEKRRREMAEDDVLPPRRSERLYPRAVKIKTGSYPRKRPVAK